MDVSSLSRRVEKNPIANVENLTSKKIIIPEKFADDVKQLCDFSGISEISPGMTITITLQEILRICPRNRQRVDAYKTLVHYLKEQLGVELFIKSKRTNSNKNENLLPKGLAKTSCIQHLGKQR